MKFQSSGNGKKAIESRNFNNNMEVTWHQHNDEGKIACNH
jgi:hypothetical protein